MNIFYFYDCPEKSAQAQPDKMLVKMPLETAQMLCTAHRVLDGDVYADTVGLYKTAYKNHPCTIWARESSINYMWLYKHFLALGKEYTYRYGKKHATLDRLKYLTNRPKNITINNSMTEMPQCMPDYCKVQNNPIQAYKSYYINEKKRFATWKKRQIPNWYVKGLNNGNEDLGQDVA